MAFIDVFFGLILNFQAKNSRSLPVEKLKLVYKNWGVDIKGIPPEDVLLAEALS
ncbi:hypothetical protein [Rufibacter tibetensis]|uniref:hypothetical protein n=1 Tax=Rufibacter tibetensis TaxID=512763 RepID=UPI0012F8585C|nr:hypothetical protein [Rufibacter tibetensis]